MIGFTGQSPRSLSARLISRYIASGRIGAVFFVTANVGNIQSFQGLIASFEPKSELPPLIAIDHEGGIVQRLVREHGAELVPSAHAVAQTMSPREAEDIYYQAALYLAKIGININLGPVLDIHDPQNEAIGRVQRAFDDDVARIYHYGAAFIRGSSRAGVYCAAKHFPGHGRSTEDSHYGFSDISEQWNETEISPYAELIRSPHPPAFIMTGHLQLRQYAPDGTAASLSREVVTGLLRDKLGYQGIILTDDIDMQAISDSMNRKEAFIRALASGTDMVMIRNALLYDPFLPLKAARWVKEAIQAGRLSREQIMASAEKVRQARKTVLLRKSA